MSGGSGSDWVLLGTLENGEALLNSCYLKRSAGDRREGGAYAARNEHLGSLKKKSKPVCSIKEQHFVWSGLNDGFPGPCCMQNITHENSSKPEAGSKYVFWKKIK